MEETHAMKEAIQETSRDCRRQILQAAESLIEQEVLLNTSAIAGSNVQVLTDVIMEQSKGSSHKTVSKTTSK